MKETVVQKIFLLIVMLWIMLSIFFVYQDLSRKIDIISQENKEFIWDKEFYANEIGNLNKKLDILIENKDHQNALIVTSVKKAIDDNFNRWFECLIDNP